jgi:hypothetical protein
MRPKSPWSRKPLPEPDRLRLWPQFGRGLPPARGRRRAVPDGRSAEGAAHLLVCRELAGGLFRVGQPSIHRDLEDAATGPLQADPGRGVRLQDQVPRLAGARFVASHSAVFDFDLHAVPLLQCGSRNRLTGGGRWGKAGLAPGRATWLPARPIATGMRDAAGAPEPGNRSGAAAGIRKAAGPTLVPACQIAKDFDGLSNFLS